MHRELICVELNKQLQRHGATIDKSYKIIKLGECRGKLEIFFDYNNVSITIVELLKTYIGKQTIFTFSAVILPVEKTKCSAMNVCQ